MASDDDFSDLLIFKGRNVKPKAAPVKEETSPEPKAAPKKEEAPLPQKIEIRQQKPAPAAEPARSVQFRQAQQMATRPQPARTDEALQSVQKEKQKEAPATKASAEAKSVKNVSCINHPWRGAYAYCATDGLPYCFVDLISYEGKMYCLNDIDAALRLGSKQSSPSTRNGFSMLSSALLLLNSAMILYYTQNQARFILGAAIKQGVISFIFNLNPLYFFPVADILVIAFGILGALFMLKNSVYLFSFAFFMTFGSAFIMGYQYLSNSTGYALASSIIFLITASVLVYSRMSSVTTTSDKYLAPTQMDWPKPEVF